MWVSGHCGIAGNEIPDKTAKQATKPRVSAGLLPTSSDLSAFIHLFIIKKWHELWQNQKPRHNKLLPIKPTPVSWSSTNFHSRRLEIFLTRLRIGHTRLTPSHLVSDLFPLTCDNCGIENPLTVAHLFSCSHLTAQRNFHHVPHNCVQALANDPVIIHIVFSFLHTANRIRRI